MKNKCLIKLKKRFKQLGIFSVFIVITACGGGKQQAGSSNSEMNTGHGIKTTDNQHNETPMMHNTHNILYDNFAHKDIVILEQPYQPSADTKAELEQVVNAYLQVKDALVNDDIAGTDKATVAMSEKVAAVIPNKMEGKGLEAWHSHQVLYLAKLKEMQHIKSLENKRSYFSHISEIMYCTIKSFGLKQGKLFAVFCPMAFDGKGAYWISDNKVIQNPYLGSKMPTCGEVKEEL